MLIVDKISRYAKARAHSATHILHQSLNEFFPVKQHGSLVDEDYLRFDFYGNNLTKDQLKELENKVNYIIKKGLPLKIEYLPYEEAIKIGAKAFFEEKYPEIVRVVSFGDYSKELCFGTHVENTSLIGAFKIIFFESIASGVKRIIAYTGPKVSEYALFLENKLDNIKNLLNTSDIEFKITKLINDNKEKEKKIDYYEDMLVDLYIKNQSYIVKEPFDRIYYIDLDIPLMKFYIKIKNSGIKKFLIYNKNGYYIACGNGVKEWKENFGIKGGGSSEFIQGKDDKIYFIINKNEKHI